MIFLALRWISLWRVYPSFHWGVALVIVTLITAAANFKVSAVAEISETAIISEATIIPWGIVVVIPAAVVVILMIVSVLVHVVWLIGVAIGLGMIFVFLIVTCRVKGTPRVVMWPVFFPRPCRLCVRWGWLRLIGTRLNLVNCGRVLLVQHVIFALLYRMDP